jgi:hypothetical protein
LAVLAQAAGGIIGSLLGALVFAKAVAHVGGVAPSGQESERRLTLGGMVYPGAMREV